MNKKLLSSLAIIAVISFSLLVFGMVYENSLPKIVEEINNASIGAILGAIVTVLLLKGQTDSEKEREKDVRIFGEKVRVYSEFSKELWNVLEDEEINEDELKKIREICFKELVFFLNKEQIEKISKEIKKLSSLESVLDDYQYSIANITLLLQYSLKSNELKIDNKNDTNELYKEAASFISLYNSFNRNVENKIEDEPSIEQTSEVNVNNNKNYRFWHFNSLSDKQLKVFEEGRWYLSLIEYGEIWRTNLLKQVAIGDVVFLFRKGGYGYVGAFKVIEKITLDGKDRDTILNDPNKIKYDIYDAIRDGASSVATLVVTPIAYNYKGVGYKSVRRRTIERMNDINSVRYLIERFKNLEDNRKIGNEKLNENLTISDKIDKDYFKDVYSKIIGSCTPSLP